MVEAKSNTKTAYIASLIQSLLTLAVISNSLVFEMHVEDPEYKTNFHKFLVLELSLVIIGIILELGKSKHLKGYSADKMAIVACSCLALYTLVSDILVDKSIRFSGIVIFIFFTVLAYIWDSMKKNEEYIKQFERAVQWFLVLLVILSILIKDANDDGRFSGPIANPSIYALYLGGIWAVLLGSMENHIFKHSRAAKFILTGSELSVTLGLALLSQSLTPLIAMVLVTILWMFRIAAGKKGIKFAVKLFIIVAIAGTVALAGLIWYARSTDIESGFRLIGKIQSASLSTFLSNRDYYWREYFNHMNLLGHSKKPFLWDHRILPHNAIVGMMYWYGVPSAVLYILMMIMAIEKSYRFADTSIPYSAVPFYSVVSFVIMSMADNVEQPFMWLPWIACYLMMAPILLMPVEEIEALKIANADICTEESDRYDQ